MHALTFKQSRTALIVLCCLTSTACATPPASPDLIRLQDSLNTWTAAQATMKGNYSYTVRRSSWTGFGSITKVEVQAGKVVRRSYEAFNSKPQPVLDPTAKPAPLWIETGEQLNSPKLNSHPQGAPALTAEAMYDTCKTVLQADLASHQKRYLAFDQRGFLTHCFTIDTRMMDDAPQVGVPSFTID